MISASAQHRSSKQGFTLAELVVAIALLALVMVVLVQAFSSAGSLWGNTRDNASLLREARSAIELAASDLSSLYHSSNSTQLPLVITPKDPATGSNQLGFVASLSSRDDGDLSIVSYAVSFFQEGNDASQKLFRRAIDPASSFPILAAYLANPDPGSQRWGATGEEPAALPDLAAGDEPAAFNVVSFTATPFRASRDPITGATTSLDPEDSWHEATPPDVIDISITVLPDSVAARIRTAADWSLPALLAAGLFDPGIPEASRATTFTRRIVIRP